MAASGRIYIENAHANNLKHISLEIPHHQFVVVTGVSGSGKSSLAFDIIAREGQRRYFETLPSFARQFTGKISPVKADRIEGLSPVITVGQKTTGTSSRSTVGTLSDLYSWLRLLYARVGVPEEGTEKLTRSLFSFNSPKGKCQRCNGLGQEEETDLNKLIVHPEKSIRQGALAPTLPTGYIMYSQVTIDVLNEVCEAEGFNVDIPWNELTIQQQEVILYGSEKIKVPFGKHSLESRLKWTGIKAKPREKGYYKGMIPIMSDILRRDRNANILKYVSAVTCKACNGKRLNQTALAIRIHTKNIADLLEFSIGELHAWLSQKEWNKIAQPIVANIQEQLHLLSTIGLRHLRLNEPAGELSGSEIQRIRIANQTGSNLSNVLYVFDEPSIGLHREENKTMIKLLRTLVDKGNTVIVVEHDAETIRQADWIIDIGPKSGKNGGQILFNGPFTRFLKAHDLAATSATYRTLTAPLPDTKKVRPAPSSERKEIILTGCREGKLTGQSFNFKIGNLTCITGKSGSGKSDLVKHTLKRLVTNHLKGENVPVTIDGYENIAAISRLVYADQSPIGRTPRSNPATYLGISDHIRNLFSKLPEAKAKKLTKSSFSFNTKGGRCETCQGAGKIQIGMHFLGRIDLVCNSCGGKRFNETTLSVTYKEKSIAEIYDLTVTEACAFFESEKKIHQGLDILRKTGLGYLSLGQSSTTLSGGEAQRIKLANALQKKSDGTTLYILDEPSIGLHPQDLNQITQLLDEIIQTGNTIVCIEQDELILRHAHKTYDLSVEDQWRSFSTAEHQHVTHPDWIALQQVSTHFLKTIDVRFPKEKLSVVTGVSGSGKSSLVYDSLYAEAQNRFSTSLSTYNRSLIRSENKASIQLAAGLTPTIALKRKKRNNSGRSTISTLTGIHAHLRILYSRIAQLHGHNYSAQHFSFNHKLGACVQCTGLGYEKKCVPELVISDPSLPLLNGALTQNKAAKYYTNLQGQFVATLKEIAEQKKWDLDVPWRNLPAPVQEQILYGTGDTEWDVDWKFETKTRSGSQQLKTKWLGFCNYINDEYERKQHNKNIRDLTGLLQAVPCEKCNGERLKPELLEVLFQGKNIAAVQQMSVVDSKNFMKPDHPDEAVQAILKLVLPPINQMLDTLTDLGLGYLTLDRPAGSLSGGEFQRIQLAGQFSARLYGVTYVLDEPTIGLDQKQVEVLIRLLRDLIKNGNTVIVIEHDAAFIKAADYIAELGPSSGKHGGALIYQGSINGIKEHPETLTHDLFFNKPSFTPLTLSETGTEFGVSGAGKNNLKDIDVSFKSGAINAITGVSGSGKSTLVQDVIYKSVVRKTPVGCTALFGFDQFDEVSFIDQSPLGINRLTSPALYTGILNLLQSLFAASDTAKLQKLKKGDFSYAGKGGKCPDCNGYGAQKTSMDFMSDVWITCDTCRGSRYNPVINAVRIQAKGTDKTFTIGEVLQQTVDEALNFFDHAKLNEALQLLADIGLGHLQLGQAGSTLSGGEAQRLKLTHALFNQSGRQLYLFDEPATGLHSKDLQQLIAVFEQLILQGHTIVFIEHNQNLISIAHNVIQLGPGSGDGGGRLVSTRIMH